MLACSPSSLRSSSPHCVWTTLVYGEPCTLGGWSSSLSLSLLSRHTQTHMLAPSNIEQLAASIVSYTTLHLSFTLERFSHKEQARAWSPAAAFRQPAADMYETLKTSNADTASSAIEAAPNFGPRLVLPRPMQQQYCLARRQLPKTGDDGVSPTRKLCRSHSDTRRVKSVSSVRLEHYPRVCNS